MAEDINELIREYDRIVSAHGPWQSYDIRLERGAIKIPAENPNYPIFTDDDIIFRVEQIISDLIKKPNRDIKVLDLGCMEGSAAIDLALKGFNVVGIEGREKNVVKALFAKKALGLNNLEFFKEDVRKADYGKLGSFDVVLCLGLLYHLDFPDNIKLLENIYKICDSILILDTHVGLEGRGRFSYKDMEYWGRKIREHSLASTQEEKHFRFESSLDNIESMWLTWPSLCNALVRTGFSSVFECHHPTLRGFRNLSDRLTLVAVKGKKIHDSVPIPEDETRPFMYHFLNYPSKIKEEKKQP
jgi:SAM-dependent methyltransferase